METQCATLEDEKQVFYKVRSILKEVVPEERVTHGNTKSYFVIMMDNNNFKPICRFYLKKKKKYIGTINGYKVETRSPIEDLDQINGFADDLIKITKLYMGK